MSTLTTPRRIAVMTACFIAGETAIARTATACVCEEVTPWTKVASQAEEVVVARVLRHETTNGSVPDAMVLDVTGL